VTGRGEYKVEPGTRQLFARIVFDRANDANCSHVIRANIRIRVSVNTQAKTTTRMFARMFARIVRANNSRVCETAFTLSFELVIFLHLYLLFYGRGYGQSSRYCNSGSAILSNVFGHNNQIDICLTIFATFQRILKFVACFRRKLV